MVNKKIFILSGVIIACIGIFLTIHSSYFIKNSEIQNAGQEVSVKGIRVPEGWAVFTDNVAGVSLEYPATWRPVMMIRGGGAGTSPAGEKVGDYGSEKRYVANESLFSVTDDYDNAVKFVNGPSTFIVKFINLLDKKERVWSPDDERFLTAAEDKKKVDAMPAGVVDKIDMKQKVVLFIGKYGVKIECFPSGTLGGGNMSCKFYSSTVGAQAMWDGIVDARYADEIEKVIRSIKIEGNSNVSGGNKV
ncbi:MAG: hypothetical protein ACYC8S_00915 [Minisyncoccota bacterium]